MTWSPPKRPRWAERLIEHGEAAGGADNLVSLVPDDLIETATVSTGLTDFGGDAWREHFEVLVRALEEESNLHLLGRLVVRTEILRTLRNRLRLSDLWSRRPEILESPIEAPTFIVGSPRSGTSILHELMAQDPASRTPALWEMNHPVEAIEGRELGESADRVTRFWHDLQPEYEIMHTNSGFLPNECIFITMHEFLSDHWGGNHAVPSYDRHLQTSDQRPAYEFHERFLKTLQQRETKRETSRRWLLKAPSHLFQLPALFEIYPDARIIRTHRDPQKTLASSISLMGTLKWMRCNDVDMSQAPAMLAFGYAYIYRKEIEQRSEGTLPDAQFIDVQFEDVLRDPIGTVEAVYRELDWAMTDPVRQRIADYAKKKPQGSKGSHRYSLEQFGLNATEERERFRFYMERFGIRDENS
jgi:hypothetical protein